MACAVQTIYSVATGVVGVSSASQQSPVVGQPWYDHATASYGVTLQVSDLTGAPRSCECFACTRVLPVCLHEPWDAHRPVVQQSALPLRSGCQA